MHLCRIFHINRRMSLFDVHVETFLLPLKRLLKWLDDLASINLGAGDFREFKRPMALRLQLDYLAGTVLPHFLG